MEYFLKVNQKPENVFYGNTIPGAIIFFNKNKPKERKDKILMVCGAKKGWYKEEPNQNILLLRM
ncbi:MAG: N-6 DNA methylase [Saprospiraceae bacterium]|nr:N-6 DNA methylase [Saprospiraceae bacterium]